MKPRPATWCTVVVLTIVFNLSPAALPAVHADGGEVAAMAASSGAAEAFTALRAGLHDFLANLWSKVLPLDPIAGTCPGEGGGEPIGQGGSMIDPDG